MRAARALAMGLVLLAASAVVRPPRPDGAPVPVTAVALGGLNGPAVDLLWLRASLQQERGQFFDALETVRWLAALEPRVGGLYAFQAWNLASNISAAFTEPADRWRWITAGLRLLVIDGQQRDPNSPELGRTAASILVGRVADELDPAAPSYRRWWADEWTALLGGAQPVDDSAQRHAAVRERWGVDLSRLRTVDRAYGPFDWRSAEAHAVYWALAAIDAAGGRGHHLVLERIFYQALWRACVHGRLRYPPGAAAPLATADPALVPVVERELARELAWFPGDAGIVSARRSFRLDAIAALTLAGHQRQAEALYQRARADSPRDPVFRQPFETVLLAAVGFDPTAGPDDTNVALAAVLGQAWRLRAAGAAREADGLEVVARLAWSRWRNQLPPFEHLRQAALDDLRRSEGSQP